jgi:syntaxin 18
MDYQRQLEQDLHEETALLATQMVASNELDGVRQMETRMVEITTLIGQFSNLVQDQQEQVLQVQTSARETKQNMERGREHLVDATERTRQSRHYKAWLIFGMTLILLFFHTLRN